MIEIWKKAKENKEVLHFKNFQTPDISWEDIVNFIYSDSIKKTDLEFNFENKLAYANKEDGSQAVGNLFIDRETYLLPQTRDLHNVFKGVSELMEKVNGDTRSEKCKYYNSYWDGSCDCDSLWHIQGLRFCIADKVIGPHNDPCNVLYWQILGTSYWTINNDKVYELNPGDLLYFNQEDLHSVHHKGPRVGIIIDGKKIG